jgi:hypothetical protein
LEGWELKFLKRVSEDLNTLIVYVLAPLNNEILRNLLDNRSFTGPDGDLVSNIADIGFTAWPFHPGRYTHGS